MTEQHNEGARGLNINPSPELHALTSAAVPDSPGAPPPSADLFAGRSVTMIKSVSSDIFSISIYTVQ